MPESYIVRNSKALQHKTIKILIEDGIVAAVKGLPDDWDYEIQDDSFDAAREYRRQENPDAD